MDGGVVARRKALAGQPAVRGAVVFLGAVARRADVEPASGREVLDGLGDRAVLELGLKEEAEVVDHDPGPGGGQRVDAGHHLRARVGTVERQ